MVRTKKSGVWKFFMPLTVDCAKCLVCLNQYSTKGRTTAALKAHLRSKHYDQYAEYLEFEEKKSALEEEEKKIALEESKYVSDGATVTSTPTNASKAKRKKVQKPAQKSKTYEHYAEYFEYDVNKFTSEDKKDASQDEVRTISPQKVNKRKALADPIKVECVFMTPPTSASPAPIETPNESSPCTATRQDLMDMMAGQLVRQAERDEAVLAAVKTVSDGIKSISAALSTISKNFEKISGQLTTIQFNCMEEDTETQ